MSVRHDPTAATEPRVVSRRTVVRGAAWSVPVVMVAAAAPALAASCASADITVAAAGTGCHPNNGNPPQQFSANVAFHNASGSTGTVRMISVTVNTGESVGHTTGTFSVAGGATVPTALLFTGLLSDGTTRTFTITYVVDEATCPTQHTTAVQITYLHC